MVAQTVSVKSPRNAHLCLNVVPVNLRAYDLYHLSTERAPSHQDRDFPQRIKVSSHNSEILVKANLKNLPAKHPRATRPSHFNMSCYI